MNTPTLTPKGYVLDGRTLPRVSAILATLAKPGLEAWRQRVGAEEAARISKQATDLGTAIHAACEAVNRYGVCVTSLPPDDLAPFVYAYGEWFREHVAEVVACEQVVWSERYQFAGTLDGLCRLHDGRLVLADIKTSGKTVDALARLQTAAYVGALHEMDGTVVDGRMVVHLPSKAPGTIHILEYDDFERDWLVFRGLCAVYKWNEQHKHDWRARDGV